MSVCVVGSGGREHALAWSLARHDEVVVTPGNPGMPAAGTTAAGAGGRRRISVTPAPATEVDADLFVIGPEAPLVDGLADRLRAQGKRVVGPGADGARLEGSKAFMKEVLTEAGVPTARYGAFDEPDEACAFLRTLPGPWVVKTDGLAAGKGVLVAPTLAEAEADLRQKLAGTSFGAAGRRIVVEEGLAGEECTLLALCDGARAVPLPAAQDFKRVADGDTGPNTGGMGAYSPMPQVGPALVGQIMDEGVEPLVAALRRRGIEYRGVLMCGLMLTADGPKVLEYNVRFGDPEAQVVLSLLDHDPDCDLLALLMSVAEGSLAAAGTAVPPTAAGTAVPPFAAGVPYAADRVGPSSSVIVVLASSGYPELPRSGDPIAGLGPDGQLSDPVPGVTVFHAGTARPDPAGPFLTAGGRVLGVTATGADLVEARHRAYRAAESISFDGMQYRTDIAAAASARPAATGT